MKLFQHFSAICVLLIISHYLIGNVSAVWYQPGETMDPACAPTESECGVYSSLISAGKGLLLEDGTFVIDEGAQFEWSALQEFIEGIVLQSDFLQNGSGSFTTGTGNVQLRGNTIVSGSLEVSGMTTFSEEIFLADGIIVSDAVFNLNTGNNAINIGSDQFEKEINIGNNIGNTSLNLSAGSGGILLSGSHVYGTMGYADFESGGYIGEASETVDLYSSFIINQITEGQELFLPTPTNVTPGRVVYLMNEGYAPFSFIGNIVAPGETRVAVWNGAVWTNLSASSISYFSQVQSAQNDNVIDNGSYEQNWHWDSLTVENGLGLHFDSLSTGVGLSINSTSENLSSGSLLYIGYSGPLTTGNLVKIEDETNDSTPFIVNSLGNVGIGDDAPEQQLSLRSEQGDTSLSLTAEGVDSKAYFVFQSARNVPEFSMGLDKADSNKFKISTSQIDSLNRFTIDNNGFIGIGTDAPMNLLDLQSIVGEVGLSLASTNNNALIKFGRNSSSPEYVMGFDHDNGLFKISLEEFGVNDVVIINETGNTSIGSTDIPLSSTLTLGSVDEDSTQGGELAFSTGSSDWFYIDTTYNEPVTEFSIMDGTSAGPSSNRAYIQSGINGWQTPSDARLKTDVETLDGVLGKLESVRGVEYSLIESGSVQIGVIAQEMQSVFPNAVTTSNGLYGVNYDSVAAIALQGVKELDEKMMSMLEIQKTEVPLSGVATIPAEVTTVAVSFSATMTNVPQVVLTPKVLGPYSYAVTEVNREGFIISISEAFYEPVTFSWVAL